MHMAHIEVNGGDQTPDQEPPKTETRMDIVDVVHPDIMARPEEAHRLWDGVQSLLDGHDSTRASEAEIAAELAADESFEYRKRLAARKADHAAKLRGNQGGFIAMIVLLMALLIAAIMLAYWRVASSS